MTKSIYQLINEAAAKKPTNESRGGLKIEFHGSSVIDEKDKEGHQVHRSPFSHYIVTHPNGERQHVSVDHDYEGIIIHKKDPYRKNGAGRGSKPFNKIPPSDEDNDENLEMIRDAITPKTKVRMIK
jgi:hypothetical protein